MFAFSESRQTYVAPSLPWRAGEACGISNKRGENSAYGSSMVSFESACAIDHVQPFQDYVDSKMRSITDLGSSFDNYGGSHVAASFVNDTSPVYSTPAHQGHAFGHAERGTPIKRSAREFGMAPIDDRRARTAAFDVGQSFTKAFVVDDEDTSERESASEDIESFEGMRWDEGTGEWTQIGSGLQSMI